MQRYLTLKHAINCNCLSQIPLVDYTLVYNKNISLTIISKTETCRRKVQKEINKTYVHSITRGTSTKRINLNDNIKVKVTFSLEQATKAQRGSRGIAVLFL